MKPDFSGQLDAHIKQAGLSFRQMSRLSGIPHQTIFNWTNGSQPRWHACLSDDLYRLGNILELTEEEMTLLLQLAGCNWVGSESFFAKEISMDTTFRIPKGWKITGDDPRHADHYEIGVDPALTYENRPCVTIKANPDPIGFAGLAQEIRAEGYRGKRLRFSAALRSVDLENRVALFMRVDDQKGKSLAFDNMRDRFISGTHDWAHHAIVLDVSEEAEGILFGFFSVGAGQAWMADVELDVVDQSVPTTDILAEIAPYFPTNLDFEE